MAAKKRSRKKPTVGTGKVSSAKLSKRKTGKKKVAKRSAQPRAAKKKTSARRAATANSESRSKRRRLQAPLRRRTTPPEEPVLKTGGQAGDLQGLSAIEDANGESVDELLQEGNAFEAQVVTGVEEAADRAERGVRTHEVPEDDVPEEYLDNE